jgi:thiosulfate/3-mercaptopyruvate sulfurtransferase
LSPVRPQPNRFAATFNPALVRKMDAMIANVASGAEQVIDSRGPAKFAGTQEDVFAFKRLGHMPNAVNIPWADLIHPDEGTFIAKEAIAARFASAGIDLQKPIVTTCASGVTSCVVALGLHLLGHTSAAVYDGSWAEWSRADDTPVAAAA